MSRLGHALPGVSEAELRFRWDCVAGILRGLVAGSARTDLDGCCPADLERMLVPVLAGALAAPRATNVPGRDAVAHAVHDRAMTS